MKPSTRNRTKGTARMIKGKTKAAIGRATGNRRLQAKGRAQAAVGRVQRDLGRAERDLEEDRE